MQLTSGFAHVVSHYGIGRLELPIVMHLLDMTWNRKISGARTVPGAETRKEARPEFPYSMRHASSLGVTFNVGHPLCFCNDFGLDPDGCLVRDLSR